MRSAARVVVPLRRLGNQVTYLSRELFGADENAPLASPRACEPGPGTMTVIDLEGDKVHTLNGDLVIDALSTGGYGRAGVEMASPPLLSAGLSVIADVPLGGLVSSLTDTVGFGRTGLPHGALYITGFTSDRACIVNGSGVRSSVVIGNTAGHRLGVVIGTDQASFFFGDRLVYLFNSSIDSSYNYPQFASYSGGRRISSLAEIDLTANGKDGWSSKYGTATSRAVSPSVGNTQTCDADVFVDLESVTLPASGEIDYAIRYSDDNNCVAMVIGADGSIAVKNISGGTPSTPVSGPAATVSSGNRVTLRVDAGEVRLYVDNTHVSPQGVVTVLPGSVAKVRDLGTGGIISAATCYPIDHNKHLVVPS